MVSFDEYDDEELLDLYDTTLQLIKTCQERDGANTAPRVEKMSKKLLAIEEELKSRSLWEGSP
ncbi:MAG: hypothetical protein JSU88_05620 [Nitrospinaceae bacterium]|jgi:hypothetical protein|nr:MAG: hypothetical protein JSU88_05620 [Nitrospinaceae bacterium]